MTTATAPAPQSNQKTIPEMVEEHLARDRHERSPQGRAEAEFETSRQLYHSMGVTRDAYVARRVPEIVAAGNPDPDPELTEVSVRMADIDYRREYKAQESILSQSFTEASYVEFRRQEKRQTMTATPPQQTSPQPPAVVEAEAPATPLSELTEADFRAEYAAHAADVFAPFGISEEAYITCRKAEQGQRAG